MGNKVCLVCNKSFNVKPYREHIAKYCSQKCYLFFGQKGRIPWNKNLHTGLIPKTAFKKGVRISPNTQFVEGQTPWNKGKTGVMPEPWNKNKPFDAIRNEKHWAWKGGITSTNVKIRNSVEYKNWRSSVFKRDNFTCVKCGQYGGTLNADHIRDFAYYPELRFELSNGQTLCIICHKKKGTYKGKNYERNKYSTI